MSPMSATTPMSPARLGHALHYGLHRLVARRPALFFPYMRLREKYRSILVSPHSEVVIEGYPRSGNTFAVAAFELAQGRPVRAARHTHAPAQVMEAVRRGLPTLILVRQPCQAATSLMIREPRFSPRQALALYLWFYQGIRPYREGYVIAPFDEVVSDFGRSIRRLNQVFATRFLSFEPSPANTDEAFRRVEMMERLNSGGRLRETHVARPSDSRGVRREMLDAALGAPELQGLLQRCHALYAEFMAGAARVGDGPVAAPGDTLGGVFHGPAH